MKLDTNQAWAEASAMVSANRQVLLAMAGVFFVLPSLVMTVMVPEPDVVPSQKDAMFAVMADYYRSLAPWMIPMFLASALGTLSLLALFTDPDRPTVGDAIRSGARGLLTFLGAQLLLALAFLVLGGLIGGLGAATGSVGLAVLVGMVALVLVIYASFRLVLAGAVIIAERQRNPVAALQRAWALAEGNVGRLILFMLLITLVFVVVLIVAMIVLGAVLALTLGGEPARILAAVGSSSLTATFTVYQTACLAAIHRQLSGGGANLGSTFS